MLTQKFQLLAPVHLPIYPRRNSLPLSHTSISCIFIRNLSKLCVSFECWSGNRSYFVTFWVVLKILCNTLYRWPSAKLVYQIFDENYLGIKICHLNKRRPFALFYCKSLQNLLSDTPSCYMASEVNAVCLNSVDQYWAAINTWSNVLPHNSAISLKQPILTNILLWLKHFR